MVEYAGTLRIELDDNRQLKYNESTELVYDLYADELDEILSIEQFKDYCKRFALAMGFHPNTVDQYFGKD